jgi:hypothetical protein
MGLRMDGFGGLDELMFGGIDGMPVLPSAAEN